LLSYPSPAQCGEAPIVWTAAQVLMPVRRRGRHSDEYTHCKGLHPLAQRLLAAGRLLRRDAPYRVADIIGHQKRSAMIGSDADRPSQSIAGVAQEACQNVNRKSARLSVGERHEHDLVALFSPLSPSEWKPKTIGGLSSHRFRCPHFGVCATPLGTSCSLYALIAGTISRGSSMYYRSVQRGGGV
jgi:hypothetical protein